MNGSSELAKAMPASERNHVTNNTPAVPDYQQGHIPFTAGTIDYEILELPQKPYVDGNGKEKDANLRIPYFPRGFTVGKVLSKDLSEVTDPDDDVTSVFDEFCPEKTALHVEFCETAYGEKIHMKQQRTPLTRAKFAEFAAREIKEILARFPKFPYTLDQIRVLSIDVRSRGTVQPRIFVASDVMQTQVQA